MLQNLEISVYRHFALRKDLQKQNKKKFKEDMFQNKF